MCEMCACSIETKTCGKCKDAFCDNDGNMKKTKCCGLALCFECSGKEGYLYPGEEAAHQVETLKKCGHQGCNLYKGECRVCDVQNRKDKETALMIEDKPLVEKLLENAKSETLKKSLAEWLKTTNKRTSSGAAAPKATKKSKT